MAVPAARLTRRQIIDQALAVVGNDNIVGLARVRLNRILEELHSQYDWPWQFVEATVTLSGSSFALPETYLRTEDEDGLEVTVDANGREINWVVREKDKRAFRAARTNASITSTLPDVWCPDRAQGLGLLWPVVESAVTAVLRYKTLPADEDTTDTDTYDESLPVFPYTNYLIEELTEWGKRYEMDSDSTNQVLYRAAKLDQLRGAALPTPSIEPTIPLDATTFKTPFRR